MRKAIYRTRNRVDVKTGYALFDRHCNVLATGNVCGGSQHSSYIRPAMETECNGRDDYPVGHLRDFDLKSFSDRLPEEVLKDVLAATRATIAILYEFRIPKHGRSLPICYILTRGHDRNYELVWAKPVLPAGMTMASWKKIVKATDVIKDYVSNPSPPSPPSSETLEREALEEAIREALETPSPADELDNWWEDQ